MFKGTKGALLRAVFFWSIHLSMEVVAFSGLAFAASIMSSTPPLHQQHSAARVAFAIAQFLQWQTVRLLVGPFVQLVKTSEGTTLANPKPFNPNKHPLDH